MRYLAWGVLALAFLVVGASRSGSQEAAVGAGPGVLPQLTLEQAAGQRMVFAYAGLTPPRALERRIARGEAAGVILFARNIRSVGQLRATVDRLQAIPRPPQLDVPLLVMVDQEGGPVRRLAGAPRRSASAMTSPDVARASGRAAAALLTRAGVNVDLAPVVDVARRGSALERERRTFSRDPAVVAQRAGAFARGLQAGGVKPVLKHFPGLGAATVNTDDAPVRIDVSLARLRAFDGLPYARIPTDLVMTSTAVYPRVDPRPAAFSRRWVTGELRGRLAFGGIVLTDDLQTPSVARFGTPAQLAYFAVSAGVDVPLFARDYTTGARAAQGLVAAVRQGALRRQDLDVGAQRVLALRTGLEPRG